MRRALCAVLLVFAFAGAVRADVLTPWSVVKDRPTTGRTKVVIREAESADKASGAVSGDLASGDAVEKRK